MNQQQYEKVNNYIKEHGVSANQACQRLNLNTKQYYHQRYMKQKRGEIVADIGPKVKTKVEFIKEKRTYKPRSKSNESKKENKVVLVFASTSEASEILRGLQ